MKIEELQHLVTTALDDMKARDVRVLDVRKTAGFTDFMVVASGTSSRHVKSMADRVELDAKQAGVKALGNEGRDEAEWVLVDFGDLVVHVMLPEARTFYDIERLWSVPAGEADKAQESGE